MYNVGNFGSRCLHFGSKTLNIVKTKEDDELADKIFKEKHNLGDYNEPTT